MSVHNQDIGMYENILVPTDGSDDAERGIESTTSVLRGLPHEVILEYADDHDIDLVVMGKRGAAGVEAPHMGSVTDRVIRAAEVPVVPI